jgi:integrase
VAGAAAVAEAIDVLSADDPRRAGADLAGRKLAPFNHALDGRVTYAEPFGSFLNCELAAYLPFAWGVVRDRVVRAETSGAASCPAISLRRFDPHAVELGRSLPVGHHSCQLFDERHGAVCGLPAMLARFAFAEIKLGVLAALPMHQNPQCRRLDIDNDLFNNRADDPLLELERRSLVMPQARQIPGELPQVLFFLSGKDGRRWIELGDAAPGAKYKAALSVAYGAGLRASEVLSLKVSDIDSART